VEGVHVAGATKLQWGPLDWTASTRLSMIFEFETSDISTALTLHVGFR